MQSFYEWAYVVERRFSTSQHVGIDTVASRPQREQSAAASAAMP